MTADFDRDVVIVGGGPAGCSAGVFCARDGLDTVIFDRGRSSLKRCAHLENYLGFPAGIDVETFYGLAHGQAETAGCEIVSDLVESVDRTDDGGGFVVDPQERDPITARRVVAATRYDAEYMRGLDDAMFETYEHDGEEHERFDRSYPGDDGTTSVAGLYVASPSEEADAQAIMAAGRGARVAHRVIADARLDDGWWKDAAEDVDWMRREANLTGEWADRETWVEWFDDHHAENAPVDVDADRFKRVRATSIDGSLSSYLTDEEIDRRAAAGHRRLAARLDPEAIADAVDADRLLDSLDDTAIESYLDGRSAGEREAQ